MPQYVAALMVVLLLGTVVSRVLLLRRTGTRAMHFGELDKTDFLIPPVALFYFYTIFAAAFGWPLASSRRFFQSTTAAWFSFGRQPGVVREEVPDRHRCRSARSPGDDGHLRGEPQSDLRRLLCLL